MENPLGTAVGLLRAPLGRNLLGLLAAGLICSVALFPKQLSATTSIPCTFSYSSGGSNMAGDFAYDMFLRWDNARSTPQLEVMVWAGNDSRASETRAARKSRKAVRVARSSAS